MPIPNTDAEYDAPIIQTLPAYQQVRNAVLKVAKEKQGQAVTYGYVSRQVPREAQEHFDDVLRDLASEGVLAWRCDMPAPSAIRF